MMKTQILRGLVAVLVMGVSAQAAEAASYQRIGGTIVDPILDRLGNIHPYSGPDLEPGMPRPGNSVNLTNANLIQADLRSSDLGFFELEDADLSGSDLSGAKLHLARLAGAILANADLERASLYWSNLLSADLSNAVLDGADLSRAVLGSANLTGASFVGAYYDVNTSFPAGFDPVAAGMVTGLTVVNNGLAPPASTNVFDSPERDIVVDNAGCNALLEYPCVAPGAATAVSGSLRDVRLYETSSFVGSVGGLTAHDDSNADVTLNPTAGGVSALDSSTVVANAFSGPPDCVDATASGDANLHVVGQCWDTVLATGHSEVTYAGGGWDGSDLFVSEDAFVDYQGYIWGLYVRDRGRAVVRSGSEVQFWISVGPDGAMEMEGGNHADLVEFEVQGRLEIGEGVIGPSGVRVAGYADIRGGRFRADPNSYWNGYGQVPGPWNFVSEGSGSIDLSGGQFVDSEGAISKLSPLDASRIRIFGSAPAVDGLPIPFGSVAAQSGTVSALLADDTPLANEFAHRGADCGGQPCTGRILVLAPGLDWDQDALPNAFDNCAEEPNADQADLDADGTGDVCFAPVDLDHDAVVDALDNCRIDANPDQADTDSDGLGDACDEALVVWTDPGTSGCTSPPQPAPYAAVTGDLANDDFIDRSAQPCDCMGLELPADPGVASVRFVHVSPGGVVKEVCENAAPYAFGLAPGQPLCSTSLAQNGAHAVMVTPYDAPGCEAGGGTANASSIRRFAVPEPETGLLLGTSLLGLARLSRRRARSSRPRGS